MISLLRIHSQLYNFGIKGMLLLLKDLQPFKNRVIFFFDKFKNRVIIALN